MEAVGGITAYLETYGSGSVTVLYGQSFTSSTLDRLIDSDPSPRLTRLEVPEVSTLAVPWRIPSWPSWDACGYCFRSVEITSF